jgi:small-conductance mechanosensitive channel
MTVDFGTLVAALASGFVLQLLQSIGVAIVAWVAMRLTLNWLGSAMRRARVDTGTAFSLAVQDILKNFFSGVYLLLERPFRVGDTIRVKDQQGVVENIGVRTTMLRTAENVEVLVPNVMVFTEVVTNHSQALPPPPAPEPGALDGQAAAARERPAAAAPPSA